MSTTAPETTVVVDVGIDPNAIVDPITTADPALGRLIHEELLEALCVHGRLIFLSTQERTEFVRRLKELPSSLSKLWETLITSGRIRLEVVDAESTASIGQAIAADELVAQVAQRLDLVLLETDHARQLGVPTDAFSALAPGSSLELGRVPTATRTHALGHARELLDAPIRVGDNRDEIWRDRFAPFVDVCKTVIIYDRYAGVAAARRYLYDDEDHSRDALTWMLEQIAVKKKRRVRLITAVMEEDNGRPMDEQVIAQALQSLRDSLGKRKLKLDVVLVPDGGRRFGHDRHIRFGDRVALTLGTGIQVFADEYCDELVSVGQLPIHDAKERERFTERHQIRPPEAGWIRNKPQKDLGDTNS